MEKNRWNIYKYMDFNLSYSLFWGFANQEDLQKDTGSNWGKTVYILSHAEYLDGNSTR